MSREISQSIASEPMHAAEATGRMLGVSKWTIYRLIARGELEAVRVGRQHRVPERSITAYLRANTNVTQHAAA
jgi:excisionase family DNA binding protein